MGRRAERKGIAVGWRGFGPWRREVRAFLELFALSGVAVAQPAFDLLTKNAELMVTLRTTAFEAVLFTVLVLLVPPAVLWAVEVLVGLAVPRLRRYAHAALAAVVVTVLAIEVLKHQTDLPGRVVVVVAALVALGAGLLLLRVEVAGMFLRFLAIAPPIFAVLFLLSSDVSTAVFDSGPAAADTHVNRSTRVVMVVLDELPLGSLLDGTGRIDADLYPNFAAFANGSTWYRNTTTVAPSTEQAVPALVSGSYPTDMGALPVASEYPDNLFTLLGNEYEMHAHESLTRLCPDGLCEAPTSSGRRHGLGALLHDASTLWRDYAKPDRDQEPVSYDASKTAGSSMPVGDAFIRSLEPAQRPRLDYLHILLPHQPWHWRAGYRDDGWKRQAQGTRSIGWADAAAATAGRQRHLLQLQAADELVGDIVAKLRAIDAYRDSLIVLTADHGAAFVGGAPQRIVDDRNWPEILWVPLFVKEPGQQQGRVDDRPARTIDVLPTIADELDVELPWRVDGVSLRGAPRADGPRRVYEWINKEVRPSARNRYREFDGPTGFAAVLRRAASTSDADPALRLYQLGPFGALVGRRVEPLVDRDATPSAGHVSDRRAFGRVDRDAKNISWALVHGDVRAGPDQAVAVAVNGVVAGMATTAPVPGSDRRVYWATLAPQLFRDGRNDVRLYVVTGTPADPELTPVRLR
jgi:arylsulfatase A-like enzyme